MDEGLAEKEAWAQAEFLRTLWDPEAWWDKAHDLLRAASELQPGVKEYWRRHRQGIHPKKRFHDVHGTYFMLVGFALENLCKAAIVYAERSRHDLSSCRLPRVLKSHDLEDLLRSIGITSSGAVELGTVERLTRAVLWSGRYPVPVEASDLSRGPRIGLAIDLYCADDLEDLRQLVEFTRQRVAKVIGKAMPCENGD